MNEVKFLDLHGERVAYRDEGSGEVLLLIHGMAGSSDAWRELIPRSPRHYRVVAPDLLGHGQSAKPRGDYSLGAFAVSLRDLLDELGIAQATIVGHSLGGGVAMQFLYQHPDYCERLILISSGGLGSDVGFILRLLSAPGAEFVLPVIAPSPVLKVGNKIGSWFTSAGMRNPRAARSGGPTRRSRTARPATPSCAPCGPSSTTAARPSARSNRLHVRSELPTLAIWGEDDQIIPVDHGHAAMAARPGGRLEVLPGVGHFAHVEAPNEVAEIIDDFMRSTKHDTGVDVGGGRAVDSADYYGFRQIGP